MPIVTMSARCFVVSAVTYLVNLVLTTSAPDKTTNPVAHQSWIACVTVEVAGLQSWWTGTVKRLQYEMVSIFSRALSGDGEYVHRIATTVARTRAHDLAGSQTAHATEV